MENEWQKKGVNHVANFKLNPDFTVNRYLSLTKSVNIRIPHACYDYYSSLAKADRRPLGTYIRMILEDMMKKDLIEKGLLDPAKKEDKVY